MSISDRTARGGVYRSKEFYHRRQDDRVEHQVMPNSVEQSEQELRLAVEMTGLGIIKIDYATDSAIADDRAAELFDLPSGQSIARELIHARFHLDDREEIERLVKQTLDPDSSGVFSIDHRVVHRDGSVLWLQLRKQVFFAEIDGRKHPKSALFAAIDITARKRAENEIHQSRETFRSLVVNNPFGVYVVDDEFKMRHVSQGAEETFANIKPLIGHDFSDLMRKIWPEIFATEAIQRFRHTLKTGEPYIAPRLVETRHDRQTVEAYEWTIRRVKLPGDGYGVVCYFYNASQQQVWEDSLRESERRFRELADAAPAMLWITDENHSCNFLSRSWYEFTGQTEEEGMGLGWTDVTHPDDKVRAGQDFFAAAEARQIFAIEYRLKTVQGDYRWALDVGQPRFDVNGKFIGYVGSVIDVHERHVAEDDLRASENRIRLAAETTGFGTYDLDVVSGVNVWSDQLFRICELPFGVPPPAEVLRQLVHLDDREKYDALVDDAFATDGPGRYQLEYRIVRESGDIRWLLDTGRVFYQSLGPVDSPTRIVGTIQDITERKAFEQSLRNAKEMAELASRSRGEFLANMSHEIRTPMAAILGHADILKDHLRDPDDVQIVETIRRNGRFLLDIINDILDLSKIDAGKLEIDQEFVRLDRLVSEVHSLMDIRASEKSLPLMIEFSGPIPELIRTDAVRLRQILLNLIGNAIKFTSDGEVKLLVKYEENKCLSFAVTDTGMGIRDEAMQSLFEPFVQADNTSTRSFGGTGLGLTICRRLADALGGEISVASEYGVGSTFTLNLQKVAIKGPLIQPELHVTQEVLEIAEEIRLTATVLVVDDRRDIRYLAQHFIEKAGGKVFTAINGREAINFFESDEIKKVDVILMDMQMPILDGYDATKELRRRGCNLPIIALTANAMKSDRDACLAVGCDDYTPKPLNSQELIAMIDRLANRNKIEL